ncbi:MAG: MFS transporter [Alphaproteobacteria bacterium]
MQESQILPGSDMKAKVSWSLFDFANSAFTTVVITFVFAAYFAAEIAPTEEIGARWWGWCMAGSGLVIAILSPVLGAIADHTGCRKPWIFVFTLMCVVPSFALWWIQPAVDGGISQMQMMVIAIVLVGIANVGFEMGSVFNNSMLPDIAPKSTIGRWSGFAWGIGYLGGLACLMICLFVFIDPKPALFGLNTELGEQIRITSPFIAIWMTVFTIPMFLFTPDRPRGSVTYGQAISTGIRSLGETLVNVRKNANLFRFLISHMFYRDGLNTLLQMGGLFAAAVYGLSFSELIQFAIILNVTAALGAFIFAWADDKFGSKPVIFISILCLIIAAIPLLAASSKLIFYISASTLGLFVGSIQASSRTMIGRLAPADKVTETYGLFAFSGKSSAFIGPLLVGELTNLYGHRIGMASLVIFLVIGLALLWKVTDKQTV